MVERSRTIALAILAACGGSTPRAATLHLSARTHGSTLELELGNTSAREFVGLEGRITVSLARAGQPALEYSSSPKNERPGKIAIADGSIELRDGGIHGVQGHTLTIAAAGSAKWQRSLDSFQPNGVPGEGTLVLTAQEATTARARADVLWALAPKGRVSFDQPIDRGVPRWVWAILLRRGDETRVIDGNGTIPPDSAPVAVQPMLAFLIDRVDAAAAAAKP